MASQLLLDPTPPDLESLIVITESAFNLKIFNSDLFTAMNVNGLS